MAEVFYITLITFAAVAVATISGFGTSTIMVPVLLGFFPLAPTLLLVGIIHWFGDVWKITLFRQGINLRLILLFGVPGVLLSFAGAYLVFEISEKILTQALGIFLFLYSIFLFLYPNFKLAQKAWVAAVGGGLSGFFAGLIGVGGAIKASFLSAFDLPKAVYLATLGAIGLAIDSARIVTYFSGGAQLESSLYQGLLFFIPASFAGAFFAKKVADKIEQKFFRAVVALFLLAFGLRFIFAP